jgi:hypothetical protein
VLSVLREVAVRTSSDGQLVVIDREPREIGAVLTLETFEKGFPISAAVRVVASNPIVRNGTLFHELRLERVVSADGDGEIR